MATVVGDVVVTLAVVVAPWMDVQLAHAPENLIPRQCTDSPASLQKPSNNWTPTDARQTALAGFACNAARDKYGSPFVDRFGMYGVCGER